MNVALSNGQQTRNKIHPHKFALWAACASIVMMFTALTSAYIVRQAAGNWLEFELPGMFLYSTIAIFVSSLTLHASYNSFKKGNTQAYRVLMAITMVLGLVFLGLQYEGWLAMNEMGIDLQGNPSGSFIFVISGLHAAHVLGGIGVLLVAVIHALGLKHQVTKKRIVRFELTLTYWHFVDVLWIYLFIFFMLQ